MKKIALTILLALSMAGLAAEPKITPGTAYRLSFEAEGQSAGARWAVHLRDAEGNLPFDGALEGEWQQLTPDRKTYTHLFYAPSDAASFQLVARKPGVTLSNVKLEKWEGENLLLNGDFSEGNYSGWSECYNTQFVNEGGKTLLRVNQNGYALTDYIPVTGGGRYALKSLQGIPGAQVLVYDSLRWFIGIAERSARVPSFEVPKGAAYLRLKYATGWIHLPAWRVNDIVKAELLPLEVPKEASPASIEKSGEWEIVLAPGSDPREEYAARELRHWMTAITEKAPALLAEPSKAKTRKIFLGRAWAEAFPEDLKALEGTDGYAVRTKKGNIYVFGANPRGTLYGGYALLERNTDIIWPRPNPEFAALFSKVPSLAFANADFLSRPAFQVRNVSGGLGKDYMRDPVLYQDWQGRNGLNSPCQLHTGNNYLTWQRGAQLGYSGSYMFWLGDAKEKDEKVWPMIDGKRVHNTWRQPCYTYKGTVDAIVATFRELLQTLPGREIEYLHATIADNWTVCGCPDCMAPIKLPNGETLTAKSSDSTRESLFFSTRNFMMLNQVAEALTKDYPGLRLRTHAYIFPAEPPKVPVHPAIIPEFAAYPTQNLRFPILAGKGQKISVYDEGIWKRRFEEWGKVKKGALGYFGYYYPDGFNAVADAAAADYQALANFGAVQAHTEGFPLDGGAELSAWDADGIEKWVIAKLLWDPSQDPEMLRKQYISRVYRGAEKEMTEFYKLIRDAWHQAPDSVFVNCHTSAKEIFQNLIIAPGIEKRAKQLLVDAENSAQDPKVKKIIQRQNAYFDRLAATLGRVSVPFVDEATTEWREPSSTHWEKAAVIQDFLKVDDWRSFNKAAAGHPSKVRVMRDHKYLYLRFEGDDDHLAGLVKPSAPAGTVFPNGDRFEVRLKNAKNTEYYLAVGPGGHSFSQPPLGDDWKTAVSADGKAWTALMAIPLNALGSGDAESTAIKARVGRVYRAQGEDREESSHNGASLFNHHESLWLNFQIK